MSSFVNPAWLPFSVTEAITAGDATEKDLESGEAWNHLLKIMRKTGDLVLSDDTLGHAQQSRLQIDLIDAAALAGAASR